jgi:hypothetical protein
MVVVPSARVRPLPNNLGPTLLIAIGVLTTPLLFGVPLVLVGLALQQIMVQQVQYLQHQVVVITKVV